jgi:Cu/Ag efflux pump CusA
MFSLYLGLAIVAALIVMTFVNVTESILTGYMLGLPVAVASGWALLFRRGRPMHRLLQLLYVREPK